MLVMVIPYTDGGDRGEMTRGEVDEDMNHVASPLMAKALAVREALLQAKALHLTNICLKSNNQVLIKVLFSKQHPVSSTESTWISRVYPYLLRLFLLLMYLGA
ncbi:unnamed protein product [Brassica rapa subsp. trilocularis]